MLEFKLENWDYLVFQKVVISITGSAKRNIEQRIERHLSSNKNLHWHIDYFLENTHIKIVKTRRTNTFEYDLNKHTAGNKIISGFGSSDCKENCGSHLKLLILA